MKIKKMIPLLSAFSLTLVSPIAFAISCSNDKTANDREINSLKNYLDSFLINKFQKDNNNNLVTTFTNQINKIESLYRILLDDSNLINTYFSIDQTALNNYLTQLGFDFTNYEINFSFFFDAIDSYGNIGKPSLSSNKSSILIPVLICLTNKTNNISITKYMNFITLDIKDTIVDDIEDHGYNGLKGKSIVFQKNNNYSVQFRSVPADMIEKYLDFILMLENDNYQKQPIYQMDSNKLKEWKGKTLSQVRQISQAIVQPSNEIFNKQDFVYEIKNATFYDKNRHYANFIMSISIDPSKIPQKFLDDAKQIYNLSFTHEYTTIVTKWEFALPSESDISAYVSNNQTILNSLVETAKNNIYVYIPKVAISPFEAREIGVKQIIERFSRNVKDFLPPAPFIHVTNNGQEREISFEIESLQEYESNSDVVTINMLMVIDKGDLRATSTFSKNFNIKTWQFI